MKQAPMMRGRGLMLALLALLGGGLLLANRLLTPPVPLDGVGRSSSSSAGSASADSSASASAGSSDAASLARLLLDACPGLPSYCPRAAIAAPAATPYIEPGGPGSVEMGRQKVKVDEFIAGPGFEERLRQLRRLRDKRGILVSAGKPHHVGNTAVLLHVLRTHLKCKLPVEVAYRGEREFDNVTRATLSATFPPVRWLDLDRQPRPAHHNPHFTMDRYEPKIFALYHSRFQQVLLLDADNLPLRDPSHLFDSPHVTRHGAMLWLDLWSPELSSTTFVGHDTVWPLLGLRKGPYWDVLAAGQGSMRRVAESGQLVLDRTRHADVLEYLWWMTSFSGELYKHILGDKDTFGFAFAMAHKLHELHAVAVPPAATFLHVPASAEKAAGWHFQAMLQYDHLGQAMFFHRTFEKWNDVRRAPAAAHVATGPLPNRFIASYLGNSSSGLTPDLPEHVLRPLQLGCAAPDAKIVAPPQPPGSAGARQSYVDVAPPPGLRLGSCPLSTWLRYQEMRSLGLPLSRQPTLEAACGQALARLQALDAGTRRSLAAAPGPHVAAHPRSSACDSGGGGAAAGSGAGSQPRKPYRRRLQLAAAGQLWLGSDALWRGMGEQAWLQACVAARGGAASSAHAGLPDCGDVEWHVARFVLPHAAEAVAVGADGRPIADVDPHLAALQLQPQPPGDAAPDAAASGGACGGVALPASDLDAAQRVALPAAVAWVNEHLDGLPMLRVR